MKQLSEFDYTQLSFLCRQKVETHTEAIKVRVRRTTEDLIEIGKALISVKAILAHGQFGMWLRAEFDWSEDTAQRLMNVAKHFSGQIPHGAVFEVNALYELARPSTPESARAEALERAFRGEQVTSADARSIINQHQIEPSELVTQPPFELESDFEKADPTPQHQCPKCGFSW